MSNVLLPLTVQRPGLDQQTDELTRVNVQDMVETLGLDGLGWASRLLERACQPIVRPFTRRLAEFDRLVGEQGLRHGARWLLSHYSSSIRFTGEHNVPREGPVLIVSNHPGLADTIALFAGLPRDDLRTVAAERPFLRSLKNTSEYLIFVGSGTSGEAGALRKVARQLKRGGAVLIFPAGEIEPDPSIHPFKASQLDGWSKGIEVIVRLARETRVVPAVVSGVVSASAQSSLLTRIRAAQKDREKLGAMLQILVPAYRSVDARVTFGSPLETNNGEGPVAIRQRIAEHVRLLFIASQSHLQDSSVHMTS